MVEGQRLAQGQHPVRTAGSERRARARDEHHDKPDQQADPLGGACGGSQRGDQHPQGREGKDGDDEPDSATPTSPAGTTTPYAKMSKHAHGQYCRPGRCRDRRGTARPAEPIPTRPRLESASARRARDMSRGGPAATRCRSRRYGHEADVARHVPVHHLQAAYGPLSICCPPKMPPSSTSTRTGKANEKTSVTGSRTRELRLDPGHAQQDPDEGQGPARRGRGGRARAPSRGVSLIRPSRAR